MKTKYYRDGCEVRTDWGIASVWKDGNQWRWALAGNEGCWASSFLAALDEAEAAAKSVSDGEVQE